MIIIKIKINMFHGLLKKNYYLQLKELVVKKICLYKRFFAKKI